MNLEFFIAKRVAANTKNSFSGKIMRIAIVAIMISMAVMIIYYTGFSLSIIALLVALSIFLQFK